MATSNKEIQDVAGEKYRYGWATDVEEESAPAGLDEDIVRWISHKKGEPEWLMEWRLRALRHFFKLVEENRTPEWANLKIPTIDLQAISYYAAPKPKLELESLDQVDAEILKTYEKLGIPLEEQKRLAGVAVDAIFDSVSVANTAKESLKKHGIIFSSVSEAVKEHPELVKKYLGSVVPYSDNYWAALNSAVFSDGSFVYIPPGVKCPLELSTYFRINAQGSGQFERTVIIADKGSYVSYLEGCSAPMRDENQLHAAVVELVALDDAEIKYATIQNWYPGNEEGVGGIYNFVTKRGKCAGRSSKISWTQVETGSAITWKYPSVILQGDNSIGEFYSVALTKSRMQADTGTKMHHIGKNTSSTIISKGISAGNSQNTYRGLVQVGAKAENARNFTRCDSLLMGDKCGAHTVPYVEVNNNSSSVEHEASTTKVSEEQVFYCQQRGLSPEEAQSVIINGFVRDVVRRLPLEFAVEANRLLEINLEGTVG